MQAVMAKMHNHSYNIYNNYNIKSKYCGTKLFLRKTQNVVKMYLESKIVQKRKGYVH